MFPNFLILSLLLQDGKEQGEEDEVVSLTLQVEKCAIGQFRKLTYWASLLLTTLFIIDLAKKSI